MPGLYSKPHLELLLKLINEANPGLMEMRDLTNSRLGVPTVYTPKAGEIANTQVDLFPLPGSFYIGKRTVYYRRIALEKLFTNMICEVEEWWPGSIPKPDWVRLINEKYNLAVTIEDFHSWYGGSSPGGFGNLGIVAESLTYTGYIPFRWNPGKRSLQSLLPSDTATGLFWDANYVEGKPLMNLVGMTIDFTRFPSAATIATGSAVNATSSDVRTMAEWFAGYTGQNLDPRIDHTLPGGLSGLTITRFTLPNANLPEANAAKFNRALVITPQAGSWFCGKIIWHYNA
ncbi:hypothetical protein D3C87_901330 [compost metagenome]